VIDLAELDTRVRARRQAPTIGTSTKRSRIRIRRGDSGARTSLWLRPTARWVARHVPRRDRVAEDDDLAAVWKAAVRRPDAPFAPTMSDGGLEFSRIGRDAVAA
jgi:hypothetical protein